MSESGRRCAEGRSPPIRGAPLANPPRPPRAAILVQGGTWWHAAQLANQINWRAGRLAGSPFAEITALVRLKAFYCAHLARGSGRIWKCTTFGEFSLPPSMWNGVRLPVFDHTPRPFQPALGSSMRPSRPLAQKPIG